MKDNSQVVVEVIDSGPGIADEIMPKIFSKFVSKSQTGIGLGLFFPGALLKPMVVRYGRLTKPTKMELELPLHLVCL